MQEDVENRIFNLCISTTKLDIELMVKALSEMTHKTKSRLLRPKTGKMTVKQLLAQNRGATSIDISETTMKDFEKILKKNGVDFAIKKDKTVEPPKYLLFFKAQDQDVLMQAFQEYSRKVLNHEKKASVLERLSGLIELAKQLPHKVVEKKKDISL